jgi:hypothetical protein
MPATSKPRDSKLIDALEAVPRESFEGPAWRVVKEGRDPEQCSAAGGRWDDETFDVLYTSLERDGAIAEMEFHLSRGQPVFPSRIRYSLHELKVIASGILNFQSKEDLRALGLDISKYGQLSYAERELEYPRTQEIAEVAHFLDSGGLVIPNARWPCANLVIFCDRVDAIAVEKVRDHGIIDWATWRATNKQQ